jgi:hypothetical protein
MQPRKQVGFCSSIPHPRGTIFNADELLILESVTIIVSYETDQSGLAQTRIEKSEKGQTLCFEYSFGQQTICDSQTSCPIEMAKKDHLDLNLPATAVCPPSSGLLPMRYGQGCIGKALDDEQFAVLIRNDSLSTECLNRCQKIGTYSRAQPT